MLSIFNLNTVLIQNNINLLSNICIILINGTRWYSLLNYAPCKPLRNIPLIVYGLFWPLGSQLHQNTSGLKNETDFELDIVLYLLASRFQACCVTTTLLYICPYCTSGYKAAFHVHEYFEPRNVKSEELKHICEWISQNHIWVISVNKHLTFSI